MFNKSEVGDMFQACVSCRATCRGYSADSYLLDHNCPFCGGILEGFLLIETGVR